MYVMGTNSPRSVVCGRLGRSAPNASRRSCFWPAEREGECPELAVFRPETPTGLVARADSSRRLIASGGVRACPRAGCRKDLPVSQATTVPNNCLKSDAGE
ncbi:hypothetical protein SKAU_G00334850 [Synaphobranchus kaupii]|uniref:Uncharacterized protein n=1 Tax=Synaphobranchus kaupii TaxID=118154 RepID=A0A9Q1ELR8_SYNKA|nr:hypothetical protein SKAU_G00334850 [Synaphobranchus kaupii]